MRCGGRAPSENTDVRSAKTARAWRSILVERNMKRAIFAMACASSLVTVLGLAHADEPSTAATPIVTVKEIMEKTITPATNVLWNAFEPPTDEQWAGLEEAAVTLLVAANSIATGGAGPMDAKWAADPAWQAFDRVMIEAGVSSLRAVRARDLEALMAAGEVLYPPCEGCHMQFNPAVIAEQ
jgi:hypothetical protein